MTIQVGADKLKLSELGLDELVTIQVEADEHRLLELELDDLVSIQVRADELKLWELDVDEFAPTATNDRDRFKCSLLSRGATTPLTVVCLFLFFDSTRARATPFSIAR